MEHLQQIKLLCVPFAVALFGGTAHALEQVRRYGWKGWLDLLSDIFVCCFIGLVFYHSALIAYPDSTNMAILSCSIGSYWGTKGFVFIKDWFISVMQESVNSLKK